MQRLARHVKLARLSTTVPSPPGPAPPPPPPPGGASNSNLILALLLGSSGATYYFQDDLKGWFVESSPTTTTTDPKPATPIANQVPTRQELDQLYDKLIVRPAAIAKEAMNDVDWNKVRARVLDLLDDPKEGKWGRLMEQQATLDWLT